MYTIHDREPIPFALVQPHQQVKPFGRPATARAARTEPLNLRVNDIAGTSTRQHCFATSPRLTNPVDPHYQWPRNQQPDAPALKFIRNTLDTSDIPGSQARTQHAPRQNQHSIQLDCSDIEGARPHWQPDWRIAAHARHASYRPNSAPAHPSHNRAVRPINYVHDIAGSSPWHASTKDAHRFKVEAAQLAHVDQADAKQLLQSKLSTVSTADMSSLSQQLASFDRECCGRIASSELAEALQNSNLELSNAEVLRVANGLSDCHGLLTYRPIASMLQRCGSTHKKSDNLQAQSVAAARMSASTEKKSADVATARADKQQQSEQNSSVDVQSQGATTVKTSRPPLTPRQTLLQSRLGNRAQQHASQPCINRVLVAASVSDTSMDAEGANAAQQRQDWGQSTEAQMLGSEQQTGRQPRSAVVLEGQIRQEPRASASSQALASAASAKQASGFAARVRPAPAKTPYWFSKGMIGDMSKPHTWRPSGDNSTIHSTVSSVQRAMRPWSAGVPLPTKHAMETQHHEQQLLARPQPQHDQPQPQAQPQQHELQSQPQPQHHQPQLLKSPQSLPSAYRRPQTARPTPAGLLASESPVMRRQRSALLEDMMTIRGL